MEKDHQVAAGVMAAQCLCFRARRVSRAITRLYDEALRPLGIQATQLTLMNAIVMVGRDGGNLGRLAEVLALDQTTLSRNLEALRSADLVLLERDPADRRRKRAVLTPAGERAVADALPLWNRAHERVTAALGAAAAEELRDRFDRTVRRVEGEGG